jgi:hypothetical protein
MFHDLNFLSPGKSWYPEQDSKRQAAYEENEGLREGRFEEVWPDLAKYLRKGQTTKGIEFCLDYPDLITTKTTDLIIGEPPSFNLPEVSEGAENPDEITVEELTTRLDFLEILDALIRNVDSLGDGVLKLSKDADGKAHILNVDPEHWFPITKRGTDEIIQHVLAFRYEEEEKHFLEVEIHDRKQIEHRLYSLNCSLGSKSATIGQQLTWTNENVPEIEDNPTGEFLIVTCHNKSDGIFGKSSYRPSLKYILKKLIIRYALEQDTLDTFSRPTFFGPKSFMDIDPITKTSVFRPGGYIAFENPDPHTPPQQPPGALVWEAHLGENEVSKESLMRRLFDVSEMSPVLFAGNLAGLAESGTALRLRLTNTLAKCARIRRKVNGSALKAINLALLLEGNPVEGLYIEWQDGLPTIPLEQAQEFAYWANTPQFAGEVGGKYLLKRYGYDSQDAEDIMSDPSRNGGFGGGM